MKIFALLTLLFITFATSQRAHAAVYYTNDSEEFSLGVLGGPYRNNLSVAHDDHGLAFDFCYMHRIYQNLFFDLRYMLVAGGNDTGLGLTKLESRDDLRMPSVGLGVLFFNFLKLNLGYGFAWLKHSDVLPNASSNNSTTDKAAQGRVWLVGLSAIPNIHVGIMKFGLSAYYFSVAAKSFTHDVFVNGVETKSNGGSASASGILMGASVFFGF